MSLGNELSNQLGEPVECVSIAFLYQITEAIKFELNEFKCVTIDLFRLSYNLKWLILFQKQ